MLSSRQFADQRIGLPQQRRWSSIRSASNVPTVPAKQVRERVAFRRRLGLALARSRVKLTDHTQATIAELLAVDTETVGRWERGEREPKVTQLAVMVEEYGAPGDWFLRPTDSITQLDARIARLQREIAEAARVKVEAEARRAAGASSVRRGKRPE